MQKDKLRQKVWGVVLHLLTGNKIFYLFFLTVIFEDAELL